MTDLHLPWLEASILISLIGSLVVSRLRDSDEARRWTLGFSGVTLISCIGAWIDFHELHALEADDAWHFLTYFVGREVFIVDQLSAPLLPLVALLFFLTTLATLRTKIRRFSFALTLLSEAIVLATFSCKEPWGIIALLSIGTIPPLVELIHRRKPIRVFVIHMGLFIAMMVVGWWYVEVEGGEAQRVHSLWAIIPLLLAVFIRSGIAPFHLWMSDLFEHATFGTALLFVTPIAGAYAAVRLVLPVAPDWVLRSIGLISLFTAVYASGMALVQREARRYFCYLFLSHSAFVLMGLEIVTPTALTGALCVWLSIGLSLGGFGLTIRALEGRRGRLSLTDFKGLYEHTPALAVCFLLTGLASVGFPGTLGFIGTELLVDGVVEAYPYIGIAIVLAGALNGIGMVQTYFRLFTGTRYTSSVSLQISPRERFAVLALAALLLIGGLAPQSNVKSRFDAAEELLIEREAVSGSPPIVRESDHEQEADGTHSAPSSDAEHKPR
ncbi:MAG: nuoM 2 [Planctomycetaceae bacterium]|nr:nuoM 2 [Planctomycetaceae bacterium]